MSAPSDEQTSVMTEIMRAIHQYLAQQGLEDVANAMDHSLSELYPGINLINEDIRVEGLIRAALFRVSSASKLWKRQPANTDIFQDAQSVLSDIEALCAYVGETIAHDSLSFKLEMEVRVQAAMPFAFIRDQKAFAEAVKTLFPQSKVNVLTSDRPIVAKKKEVMSVKCSELVAFYDNRESIRKNNQETAFKFEQAHSRDLLSDLLNSFVEQITARVGLTDPAVLELVGLDIVRGKYKPGQIQPQSQQIQPTTQQQQQQQQQQKQQQQQQQKQQSSQAITEIKTKSEPAGVASDSPSSSSSSASPAPSTAPTSSAASVSSTSSSSSHVNKPTRKETLPSQASVHATRSTRLPSPARQLATATATLSSRGVDPLQEAMETSSKVQRQVQTQSLHNKSHASDDEDIEDVEISEEDEEDEEMTNSRGKKSSAKQIPQTQVDDDEDDEEEEEEEEGESEGEAAEEVEGVAPSLPTTSIKPAQPLQKEGESSDEEQWTSKRNKRGRPAKRKQPTRSTTTSNTKKNTTRNGIDVVDLDEEENGENNNREEEANEEEDEDDDMDAPSTLKRSRSSGSSTQVVYRPGLDGKKRGYYQRNSDRSLHRRPWSAQEVESLVKGHERRKDSRTKWSDILNDYAHIFQDRTPVDLKDKWRNIMKTKGHALEKAISAAAAKSQKYQQEEESADEIED